METKLTNQIVLNKIKQKFPSAILSTEEFQGDFILYVDTNQIHDLLKFLKEDSELSFEQSTDITAVDWATRKNRFSMVYQLLSYKNNYRLRVMCYVDGSLHHPTVSDIWPGSNWQEREVYDMYGIIFDNHPDLRRMYLPEYFEKYPLRKDYPLMGNPGDFKLPTIIED